MLLAVKDTYKKYATFYGRETRKTFLQFFFFQVIVAVSFLLILLLLFYATGSSLIPGNSEAEANNSNLVAAGFWGLILLVVYFLSIIFSIASIVPFLALQSRRLHDANFSAWWLLLHLLPFGGLALFIMCCFNSVSGDAIYENEGLPRSRRGNFSSPGQTSSSDDW